MVAPSLKLFGAAAFAVSGGSEQPMPPERPWQLLVHLALCRDWVAREAAAALLWPERPTGAARTNLRYVLLQARRLIGAETLQASPDALRWQPDTDVAAFERALAREDWAAAVDCRRGPLLEGFEAGAPAPFADWLRFERARLDTRWRDALERRVDELADHPAAAAALAAQALAVDPLDEAALCHRLRALARSDRITLAQRDYQAYVRRLADELGVEPSAALRAAARALQRPAPGRAAHVRAASAPAAASALAAAAPLVGRRVELQRIRSALAGGDCRLLTLSGPGGVGKSALARAVLREPAPLRAEALYWIDLDDLADIQRVTLRCLEAIGVAADGALPLPQQLAAQVGDRALLFVLDNAEHLDGLADWVQQLLDACPRCRLLVTSRSRLELRGEWLLPLQGLPAPDDEETETDALLASDALQLFVQRAQRVQPDFEPAGCAADIAALVRRLGGLPLAIELAAPWVRVMPVAEITREIGASIGWLDGARRGREQNLHDSFEHSWRLLAEREQQALAALALCPGGFTRETARAVADAPLALLAALVDKSLLRADEHGRFGFHPLLRELALEKLGAGPPRAAAEQRFAEHHLRVLARYQSFHAIDQREALRVIGVEFSNLLAAWQWAVERRRADWLQRCASALESYLDARGEQQRGAELFAQAADALDPQRPDHQGACAYVQLARAAFAFRRGEFGVADGASRAALAAARQAGDGFAIQTARNTLGLVLLRSGHADEAAACLREVLRRARARGDDAAGALYAINLARAELDLGRQAAGRRLLEEALVASRKLDIVVGQQAALNELCREHIADGDGAAALPLAQEGLALCQRTGVLRNVAYFQQGLAEARLLLGEPEQAEHHAHAALQAIGPGGDRILEPTCRLTLATIARGRGDSAAALAALQRAAETAVHSPRAQAHAVAEYARWCEGRGRQGDALRLRLAVLAAAATPRPLRRSVQREIDAAARAGAAPAATPAPGLDQALAQLLLEPAV
ncbi:hypothetical protein HLB44_09585 [Aquincola sp. S2]|uniref:Bacterial transcriptional activator domain-containing protein n=1 Tax=Pseudaquabacterium terrae TaxID=2732868 RepID=A0ABX2EF41_9BURK|nr:BTAD domain-containing putative transcriptional regulator [Aquabacterium terrae]NRF67234.1 hypothetical protein [Aquabacterium terrae]